MKKQFEDDFMEIQAELISLCLEVTQDKVDRIYAYASIEKKSTMFNAFFEKNGRVLTVNELNIDKSVAIEFLKIGTLTLEKIKKLCEYNEICAPKEIKMYYDVNFRKYYAFYEYSKSCWDNSKMSSGEAFLNWYNEIKVNIGKDSEGSET